MASSVIAAAVMLMACAGCSGSGSITTSSARDAVPSTPALTSSAGSQGVVIELRLSGSGLGTKAEQQRVYKLEDALTTAISTRGVGEYDGNEFGNGSVTLYAYGPDADALWAAMKAPIKEFGPSNGSSVTLRYGSDNDPAAKERVVALP